MSNPQQPELARSRKTPAQDQDSVASVLEGQREPATDGPRGPVPPENQPGHHPPKEQDEPDLDAFAERLGIEESADAAREAAVQTVAAARGGGVDGGARRGRGRHPPAPWAARPPLLGIEAVTDAPHGAEPPGPVGVLLDAAPDAADMLGHRGRLLALGGGAPHRLEQLFA
jgi:hypothetical protein